MDLWICEWIVEMVQICIYDLQPRTAVSLVTKYWEHFRKSEATMSGKVKNNTSRTCLTCLRPFASFARLREHIESDHEGTMKCSFCQVIIQTACKRDSLRHLQKQKGEKIHANTTKQLKPLLFLWPVLQYMPTTSYIETSHKKSSQRRKVFYLFLHEL